MLDLYDTRHDGSIRQLERLLEIEHVDVERAPAARQVALGDARGLALDEHPEVLTEVHVGVEAEDDANEGKENTA